jgi:putative ABC transport system permease protein
MLRKLLRDLVRLWPQALAIALVMAAGVATLILAVGAHASLAETREAYYERNRFADVFATSPARPTRSQPRSPRSGRRRGRDADLEDRAPRPLPGMLEPASASFVSLPDYREQVLNQLTLRQGRFPIPGMIAR